MKNQRKHSGLPPRPPRYPQPSNATDGASSSRERSKKQILEEETEKKYGQFYPFLKSISLEKKKSDFLEIRIQELRDYLSTLLTNDERLVLETFDEAIEFGKTNQNDKEANWGFWVCSHCNQKFIDGENHVEHLVTEHGKQTKLAREVRPPPVRWINMVCNDAWKPVDIPAALQAIENQQDFSDNELVNLESDDNERTSLLERIRAFLIYLLRTGSFPESNLNTMMGLLKDDLKLVFPKSKHESLDRIAQSGLCIRFLNEPQLEDFLLYLRVLDNDCKSVLFPDNRGILDHYLRALEGITIQEKIDFSEDGECLVLDEKLLTPSASVSGFSVDGAFIDWLLSCASVRKDIEVWARLKADKRTLGLGFLKSSDLAWKSMDSWAQESMKCSKDEKELRTIEAICAQEDDMRIQDPARDEVRYGSLIRGLPKHNSVELETVRTIIHNAQAWDIADAEDQKHWAWMSKWLEDIKGDNELRRQDASIRIALQKRINWTAIQQCRVDSTSLRMESLKKIICDRFKQASRLDYRAILLPLVKLFLQDKIEKMIREDAEQEAEDAAAELLKNKKHPDSD